MRFQGVEFSLGYDQSYDLVAGDFTWQRAGSRYVQGVVNTLVAVETFGSEGDVFLSSDGNGAAGTLRIQSVEGLHLSQRAVLEYSVAKAIADATGVSMKACLEAPHQAPSFARERAAAFNKMPGREKNRQTQRMLAALGYDTGGVDGAWGGASQRALRAFLSDRGYPPASYPKAHHFAMLALRHAEARS